MLLALQVTLGIGHSGRHVLSVTKRGPLWRGPARSSLGRECVPGWPAEPGSLSAVGSRGSWAPSQGGFFGSRQWHDLAALGMAGVTLNA